MTSWIPSLKKGYIFGGVFNVQTSTSFDETYEHGGLITYDGATNSWTNTSTPVGPINEGGMVHLTTATDEILIQFGGRTAEATVVVCNPGGQFRVPSLFYRMGSDSYLAGTAFRYLHLQHKTIQVVHPFPKQ